SALRVGDCVIWAGVRHGVISALRLPRGAPVPDDIRGRRRDFKSRRRPQSLGSLLDIRHSACALRFNTSYWEADLRRLLQSLQKLGQVVLFSILPPTFTCFYSAADVFCRSRGASWPALGSFLIWTFVSGALACCCAAADEIICDIGAVIGLTARAGANITLCKLSL